MVVMILERVSPSLRGQITRWMLQPRAGVFVGNMSAMVRDKLWDKVEEDAPAGSGMMIHSDDTEQGFSVRAFGDPTRQFVDFEGLVLVRMPTRG